MEFDVCISNDIRIMILYAYGQFSAGRTSKAYYLIKSRSTTLILIAHLHNKTRSIICTP